MWLVNRRETLEDDSFRTTTSKGAPSLTRHFRELIHRINDTVLRSCSKAYGAFMTNEHGSTVAEYALVLTLVVVALISTLGRLGDILRARLEGIITDFMLE